MSQEKASHSKSPIVSKLSSTTNTITTVVSGTTGTSSSKGMTFVKAVELISPFDSESINVDEWANTVLVLKDQCKDDMPDSIWITTLAEQK